MAIRYNRYRRGEIYYIQPRRKTGSEMRGARPGIIVSNDVGNVHSEVVLVVYMTAKSKAPLPTHVAINSTNIPSLALCEQIETVSKKRIGNYMNSVTPEEMEAVEKALMLSMGINSNETGGAALDAWIKQMERWKGENRCDRPDGKGMEEIISETEDTNPPTEAGQNDIENDPRYIKLLAERNVLKELYQELLKEKTA